MEGTYNLDRVPSCNGEDVGTRDNARTNIFHGGFNVVNHLKSPSGVEIRSGSFLPGE